MADIARKKRIHDTLKAGYFSDPDDMVDVSDGPEDCIHLVVVSRKFDGRRMKEKHDLLWSLLTKNTSKDDWDKVTLSIGVSPEDVKGL